MVDEKDKKARAIHEQHQMDLKEKERKIDDLMA